METLKKLAPWLLVGGVAAIGLALIWNWKNKQAALNKANAEVTAESNAAQAEIYGSGNQPLPSALSAELQALGLNSYPGTATPPTQPTVTPGGAAPATATQTHPSGLPIGGGNASGS